MGRMKWLRTVARWKMALIMMGLGTLHLVSPRAYMRIMPPYLPWHRELVLLSGVAEIAGGVGLLIPRLRRAAAWGLIALFVAVFPANVHMAINQIPLGRIRAPWLLWLRLPFQALFIAWAWWVGRGDNED